MTQRQQGGHGRDEPREGERNEQDVTEQRVEVQGGEREPRADGRGTTEQRTGTGTGAGFTEWLASTAVRAVLVIVGVVVLLFALGQLVGLDLLGLTAEALSSEVGRWLLLAAFALLLIALAERGFRAR